jgi:rod shape determining protein RodA
MGWLNIYSAVYNDEFKNIFDISQRYGKQLLWISAAVVIIIIILMIDAKLFSILSYPIYILTIGLLIAVLIFGKEVNGARSWFEIGSLRIQPAEFAKFATNLAIAQFLSTYNFKMFKIKNLALFGIILLLPAFLILKQNDTGSALVYFSFIFILYREGMPGVVLLVILLITGVFITTIVYNPFVVGIILILISFIAYLIINRDINKTIKGIGVVFGLAILFWGISTFFEYKIELFYFLISALFLSSFVFIWVAYKQKIQNIYLILLILFGSIAFSFSVNYIFENIFKDHQRDRINNLLGIEFDPLGAGYNVHQSKIAIGSGGFSGKGFLQGTQTKFDFVPEQSTDFIFCTVGEEWGFLGTSVVIILFVFLLIRLIIIAERQRSKFSRIYAYGLLSILFFHIAINIGMTIGLAPVIGIPLPFFSYGGSSLWSFTILLFILIRLDASREELIR